MSTKRSLKEEIALIENLVQDQLTLIEARLRDLEQAGNPEDALKKSVAALTDLYESCTLINALLGHIKDNGEGNIIKAGAG
jgi:hypothetical protein